MYDREPRIVGTCSVCHEPIYGNEEYYDIEGELVHEDHLIEWARKYLVKF